MAALIRLLVTGLIRALALLPLAAQRALGRWLGRIAWVLPTESARVTRVNLELCFPDLQPAARRRLARRSLEQTGQLLAETGVVFHWPEERWQQLLVVEEGQWLLEKARADGRAVLILAPHFGNWEFLSLYLGRYAVTALYDPPRLRQLEPLILKARSRTGATLLPIDSRGLRSFYETVAQGGVVALLPDQVPARRAGVYADFFGVPALTMTFVHRLLSRFDVEVLLASAARCSGGFRVRFAALEESIRHRDPACAARAMNEAIEALVRLDPAQYQWEYKRFKGQPRGRRSPYARRRR